jgi:outer membrane biosynthesis protein TonB
MRKVIGQIFTVSTLVGALVVVRAQTPTPAAEPALTVPAPAPEPAPAPTPEPPSAVAPTNIGPALTPAETPPPAIVPAQPEVPSQPAAPKPKPKPAGPPTYVGALSSADNITMTLKVAGKDKTRTFQVTSRTRFIKGGKPAIFGDGVEGEVIAVTAKAVKGGKLEAISVRWDPRGTGRKAASK